MRLTRLVFVCLLLSLLAPLSALAADRMYVGFQDDPSFRWREDRHAVIDEAAETNASVLRTTVYWYDVAPRRPSLASNPSDPAYNWSDLDEFVRNAQARGMDSYLTIWGTPGWANLNKGRNYAPRNYADLTAFCRAVASRYSGRNPGLPYVRFYGVWNEPNLEQFLAPTFDSKGRPVVQKTYAKLYRAAYAGLKGSSPTAQVAAGETSPRGRDKPSPGKIQDSLAPATFAHLVSLQKPRIKFDAWAHHPYSVLGQGPNQKARYPNVHLTTLPRFQTDMKKWYGHAVDIWISEYGFETKPAEPRGVSLAAQAAYAIADDQQAARKSLREDARLVHLPGRPDEHVAERPRDPRRREETRVRVLLSRGEDRRRTERDHQSKGQSGAGRPGPRARARRPQRCGGRSSARTSESMARTAPTSARTRCRA